ncbi:ATP-dependent DNA ligase [Streptomyces sp. NPDC002746]
MTASSVLPVPVSLMRPSTVSSVPAGPGWSHAMKLDGWRGAVHRLGGQFLVHSRSGRDITRELPELRTVLTDLPDCVLDGEIVAAHADGRMDFGALARTPAWRASRGIAVVFTAFDILAFADLPGGPVRDVRSRPLRERLLLLEQALAGRDVRWVPGIDSADEAVQQARDLAPLGVEGVVSRRLDSPYSSRASRAWVKWRTDGDPADAKVIAVIGPVHRPWALRVLVDGQASETSPRLDSVRAAEVGRQLTGHVGARRQRDDGSEEHLVVGVVLAEVRAPVGRHGSLRFVRLRTDS